MTAYLQMRAVEATAKFSEIHESPHDDRCLRFYETSRTVRTPSVEQVSRPLSNAAVDHWRHYEPWLGALIESLGSAFTSYPEVPEDLR